MLQSVPNTHGASPKVLSILDRTCLFSSHLSRFRNFEHHSIQGEDLTVTNKLCRTPSLCFVRRQQKEDFPQRRKGENKRKKRCDDVTMTGEARVTDVFVWTAVPKRFVPAMCRGIVMLFVPHTMRPWAHKSESQERGVSKHVKSGFDQNYFLSLPTFPAAFIPLLASSSSLFRPRAKEMFG